MTITGAELTRSAKAIKPQLHHLTKCILSAHALTSKYSDVDSSFSKNFLSTHFDLELVLALNQLREFE